MHCIVFSHDSCWMETKLYVIFLGIPALHWPRHLLLSKTGFTLKILHFVICLQVACTVSRKQSSCSIYLSLFLSWNRRKRHSNRNARWGNGAWGHSSVMAENMAPSTSNFTASSTVTSSAGVLHRATKSWREISFEISGGIIFPGLWQTMTCAAPLLNGVSGSLKASLPIVLWSLLVAFSGCVNYFKGYQWVRFLVLSLSVQLCFLAQLEVYVSNDGEWRKQ